MCPRNFISVKNCFLRFPSSSSFFRGHTILKTPNLPSKPRVNIFWNDRDIKFVFFEDVFPFFLVCFAICRKILHFWSGRAWISELNAGEHVLIRFEIIKILENLRLILKITTNIFENSHLKYIVKWTFST